MKFNELEGLSIFSIDGLERQSELITITTDDNRTFKMYHDQDCCEHVYLADFQLHGTYKGKVLKATVDTNEDDEPEFEYEDTYTWTYYIIETENGKLTLRWFGSSNGYYSESVDFYEVNK